MKNSIENWKIICHEALYDASVLYKRYNHLQNHLVVSRMRLKENKYLIASVYVVPFDKVADAYTKVVQVDVAIDYIPTAETIVPFCLGVELDITYEQAMLKAGELLNMPMQTGPGSYVELDISNMGLFVFPPLKQYTEKEICELLTGECRGLPEPGGVSC
ncbi:MAG TPA: hypothetical protein VK154_09675 [Chitinophagales bacterium]|nr:hypothetical protein [Chitinophagales bacterium]